jgi:hypothetical protein
LSPSSNHSLVVFSATFADEEKRVKKGKIRWKREEKREKRKKEEV